MVRSFLAIACPLTNNMRGLYRYLDQYGDKSLRLVSEFNLHLTLRFLGAVEEARLAELADVLQQQLDPSGEFELDLCGLGFYTNAMWVSTAPSIELQLLMDKLTPLLAKQGFAAQRRAYQPHVTVARFRKGSIIKLSKMQQIYAGAEWGTVPVSEFHLYKSETLPEGARYTVLESFKV